MFHCYELEYFSLTGIILVPSCLVRRIPVAILAHHVRAAFMPRDRINGTERGDTFRLAGHEGCILLRDETKFRLFRAAVLRRVASLVEKRGKGQGVSTDMKLFLVICVPVRLFSFATAETPQERVDRIVVETDVVPYHVVRLSSLRVFLFTSATSTERSIVRLVSSEISSVVDSFICRKFGTLSLAIFFTPLYRLQRRV